MAMVFVAMVVNGQAPATCQWGKGGTLFGAGLDLTTKAKPENCFECFDDLIPFVQFLGPKPGTTRVFTL